MCGIFGYIGNTEGGADAHLRKAVLAEALCIADEVRGKHSTGYWTQGTKERLLRKRALSGEAFVNERHTAPLYDWNKLGHMQVLLGHNRFATAGAVTDKNAHPFAVRVGESFNYGIHNGIVGKTAELALHYGVREADVDSETFWRAVAKLQNDGNSVEEALESVIQFISTSADFAFVYADTASKSIWMVRSPERPIVVYDARSLGLGRWFCSTTKIFTDAWNPHTGLLGRINKVKCFETKPYRLYRCSFARGTDLEVTSVGDIEVEARIKAAPVTSTYSHFDKYGWGKISGSPTRHRTPPNVLNAINPAELTDEDDSVLGDLCLHDCAMCHKSGCTQEEKRQRTLFE